MKRIFLIIAIAALQPASSTLWASEAQPFVGHCRSGDIDLDFYRRAEPDVFSVVARRQGMTPTHLTAELKDGRFHFPAFFGVNDLSPGDCDKGANFKLASFFEPQVLDVEMCMFLVPHHHIDELTALMASGRRDVLPLKLRVRCTVDEDPGHSTRPCSKIEIPPFEIDIVFKEYVDCSLQPQLQK
jgi:hypothetical protein